MKVNLTYFKQGGKYYTDVSYETTKESLLDIWQEVKWFLEQKQLPGLVKGAGEFIVLVEVPDHPHNTCPALFNVLPGRLEAVLDTTAPKKWEYKAWPLPDGAKYPGEVEQMLNRGGEEGWQLCGNEYGCFIFKREKAQ